MSLELYLINKESKYQLYHNSIKKEEEFKLEELVETEKPKVTTFTKIKDHINSTRLKKILDNYVKKATARLHNNSLKSFKAASLIAEVKVNYHPDLTEKEAKKAYNKIARREYFKNSLSIGLNLLAIAICYVPPLTFIQGTSIPFIIIGYHSTKNISSIWNGKKNINFVENKELSILEDIVRNVKTKESLNNPDLIKYYETNYEAIK